MAADFTTLDDVKKYLNVTIPADDALLTQLISAASAWIRSYLNRDITQGTYTEVLDGTGSTRQMVGQYPVTAVTSLTVDGNAVDPSGVAMRGTLLIRTDGEVFPEGFANVAVNYTAGYASVPGDIAQNCTELVAWRYKERDRIGQASKTAGGQETVSYQTKDVPDDVKTSLNNWRKVVPA